MTHDYVKAQGKMIQGLSVMYIKFNIPGGQNMSLQSITMEMNNKRWLQLYTAGW